MDLSHFPLEVLEVLASYLSAQDLAACSSVNASWREAFNLDLFWKGYCHHEVVEYLKKGRCSVEPVFKEPSHVNYLQPACNWKIQFMKKAHLLRNWGKGLYHIQKVQLQNPVINFTLGLDSGGNHWLVVNLGDRTEVWDVQTTPRYHATVGNITGAPSYLEIVGNKLIIVDFFNFVQVFHLKLPSHGFMPSSKFFYTDSQSLCVDLSNDEEIDSIRNRLRSSYKNGNVLFVINNLLIGYYSYIEAPNESFLHVWNIDTELKFCEESFLSALQYKLSTTSCSVYISSDKHLQRLLCSLYLLDKYISKLVIYNLKKRTFSKFCLTVSGKVDWCDISGGLVATSHLLHQLHVYSTESAGLVHILDTSVRMVYGPSTEMRCQLLGHYMIQPSRESVKVVNVYDHWDSLLLYFYSVYKIIVIPPKFIAVSARPYLSSNRTVLEVWNIKEKIHLFDYVIADSDCPLYHMVQSSLTKTAVVVGRTVKLLSFW